MPIAAQIAVAISRQTWLAPERASEPKLPIVKYSNTTNMTIGKIEKNGEGYVVNFFILKNNLNFIPVLKPVQRSEYFLLFT